MPRCYTARTQPALVSRLQPFCDCTRYDRISVHLIAPLEAARPAEDQEAAQEHTQGNPDQNRRKHLPSPFPTPSGCEPWPEGASCTPYRVYAYPIDALHETLVPSIASTTVQARDSDQTGCRACGPRCNWVNVQA